MGHLLYVRTDATARLASTYLCSGIVVTHTLFAWHICVCVRVLSPSISLTCFKAFYSLFLCVCVCKKF